MSYRKLAHTAWLWIIVILGAVAFAADSLLRHAQGRDFECQFMNMEGHYTASADEINAAGLMITVAPDGRTFMFRRDRLIACHSIQ